MASYLVSSFSSLQQLGELRHRNWSSVRETQDDWETYIWRSCGIGSCFFFFRIFFRLSFFSFEKTVEHKKNIQNTFRWKKQQNPGWWFQIFSIFTPIWGNYFWSNLTNILLKSPTRNLIWFPKWVDLGKCPQNVRNIQIKFRKYRFFFARRICVCLVIEASLLSLFWSRITVSTSFFQVTFWSPKWRSLNPWRGHLKHPKRSLGRTW